MRDDEKKHADRMKLLAPIGISSLLIVFTAALSLVEWKNVKPAEVMDLVSVSTIVIVAIVGAANAAKEMLRYLRAKPSSPDNMPLTENLDQLARKAVRRHLRELTTDSNILSEADSEKILTKIAGDLSAEALEQKLSELRDAQSETWAVDRIRYQARSINARLKTEIDALGRRANVNLVIGSFISMVGFVFLAVFTYISGIGVASNENIMREIIIFCTRLSLVVMMQIFAYFFLRLYRQSIFDIKYYQNELTNVQLKIESIYIAMWSKNTKLAGEIALQIAKTERNFLLKKGETTVHLYREELEQRYETAVAGQLERLLDKLSAVGADTAKRNSQR